MGFHLGRHLCVERELNWFDYEYIICFIHSNFKLIQNSFAPKTIHISPNVNLNTLKMKYEFNAGSVHQFRVSPLARRLWCSWCSCGRSGCRTFASCTRRLSGRCRCRRRLRSFRSRRRSSCRFWFFIFQMGDELLMTFLYLLQKTQQSTFLVDLAKCLGSGYGWCLSVWPSLHVNLRWIFHAWMKEKWKLNLWTCSDSYREESGEQNEKYCCFHDFTGKKTV